jgi:predicted DNA-binding protein with PD1-like motif
MNVRSRQINPQGSRVFMGTITDGADLHDSLAVTARTHNSQTATFEMLGGLHEVEFTAYDFAAQMHREPLIFKRALEIVSGHGTISLLDDDLHVHIHLAVSFRDAAQPHGIAVVGGHAARAVVYAVEFTLTAYDGAPARRGHHAGTGLKLWDLSGKE